MYLNMHDKKLVANLDSCGEKDGEVVEERCSREVEENRLALELALIHKRSMDLEGEKVVIEEAIKGLKQKEAFLGGGVVGEIIHQDVGEFSLDEKESRIDRMMIENEVLKCERNSALKDVEVWKRKFEEMESRVLELEGRLRYRTWIGVNTNVKDGEIIGEGTPVTGTPQDSYVLIQDSKTTKIKRRGYVNRQLAFQIERSCKHKIAPSTPTGPRSSLGLLNDTLGSEDKCGVSDEHRSLKGISKRKRGRKVVTTDDEDEVQEVMPKKGNFITEDSDNGGSPAGSRSSVDLLNDIIGSDNECDISEEHISVTGASKRKQGRKVVISDDEHEVQEVMPRERNFKIDDTDNEGSKTNNESDDDDDNIPISQLKRKSARHLSQPAELSMRINSGSQADNLTNHSLTCRRRRLVKSRQGETDKGSENLSTENVEDDESEDGSESDADGLSSFIVNDSVSDVEDVEDDMSEKDGNHTDDTCEPGDESDGNFDYQEIISSFGSKRNPNSKWDLEGEMLADFGKDDRLCMRAVCALYRQQTSEEKSCKASTVRNGRGFSKYDATRGTTLGEFLTGGDPYGDLVKSVEELQEFERNGLEECHELAKRYSKQLFEIYRNKEDPFFPLFD